MIRTPSGLRWECRSCADCCTGFDLGPVEPHVVENLEAERIGERWPPAAGRWYQVRKYGDGRELLFLEQRDGHCVFLGPDRRCVVHSLFGADAKPGFCREFPFHFVQDAEGTRAIVRPDCGGFHRSSADGPEVTQRELEDALDLPRVVPRRTFEPQWVQVIGRRVPLAHWLRIEAEALERLEDVPSLGPTTALVVLRSVLAEQVDASLALPETRRAVLAAQQVLGAIEQVLQQVVRQGASAPPDRVAFVQRAAEGVGIARAKLRLPLGAIDPELQRYCHLLLRSTILARTWQALPGVDIGLGAFALGVLYASGRGGTTLDAFDPAYREWSKLTANPMIGAVFAKLAQPLSDLFVHLS